MTRNERETRLIRDDVVTIIDNNCLDYLSDILTVMYNKMTDEEIEEEYESRTFEHDDE